MVGTTIRVILVEGKTVSLLSSSAFIALVVVFIVLPRQGHPLHKGPVGGWSPEGRCCWPDFKPLSPLLLGDRKSLSCIKERLPVNGVGKEKP